MKGIESMWNDHWSIMKPAYFIIWFSFNINFRLSKKWCSRPQKVIKHKYVSYTCSMETVQQNGRVTLFPVNSSLIYILFSLLIYEHSPKEVFLFPSLQMKEKTVCGIKTSFVCINVFNRKYSYILKFYASNYVYI